MCLDELLRANPEKFDTSWRRIKEKMKKFNHCVYGINLTRRFTTLIKFSLYFSLPFTINLLKIERLPFGESNCLKNSFRKIFNLELLIRNTDNFFKVINRYLISFCQSTKTPFFILRPIKLIDNFRFKILIHLIILFSKFSSLLLLVQK